MARSIRYDPATPYENTPPSFLRYKYIGKERPPLTLDSLSFDRMGAMLETYINALHVPLLLENKDFTDLLNLPDTDERILEVERYRPNYTKQRPYVIATIGDYRAAPSFIRRDIAGNPGEPKDQKTQLGTSTRFAQEVHEQARRDIPKRFLKHIEVGFFPAKGSEPDARKRDAYKEAQEAGALFLEKLKEYRKLYNEFRDSKEPYPTDAEKKRIFAEFLTSKKLAKYNEEFLPVIERAKKALSPPALKEFFMTVNGCEVKIDNTKLMADDFIASYPALLLLPLKTVGKHMIDATFMPKQSFDFFMDVIGAESQISENLQTLNLHITDALHKTGHAPNDDLLYTRGHRDAFVKMLQAHQHETQFLYTFNKTAGQLQKIYPPDKADIAYQDMEEMLKLAEIPTAHLDAIRNPREMASLLFAIERRLELSPTTSNETITTLRRELLVLANNLDECGLHHKNIPPGVSTRIVTAIDTLSTLTESCKLEDAAHAIGLIRNAMPKLTQTSTDTHQPERYDGSRAK